MSEPEHAGLSGVLDDIREKIPAIIRLVLPKFAEDELDKDETRQKIVERADALLLSQAPWAAAVPVEVRRKLIRWVLDLLLGAGEGK